MKILITTEIIRMKLCKSFRILFIPFLTCALLGTLTLQATGVMPTADGVDMLHFSANSREIGDGFIDHGTGVSVPFLRGMISTQNANGNGIVLMWFGGKSLMEINVDTGESEEYFYSAHALPFSSLLSSERRYFTQHGGKFLAFNPDTRQLTLLKDLGNEEIVTRGMYEDHNGWIWGAANVGHHKFTILAYDPNADVVHDYGILHDTNGAFRPRPRVVTGDDHGWIYFTLSNSDPWIYGFKHGETDLTQVGKHGDDRSDLRRGDDGKAYHKKNGEWLELYNGESRELESAPDSTFLPNHGFQIATGTQALDDRTLPSGERVSVDLDLRRLTVTNPSTGENRSFNFSHQSGEGSVSGVISTLEGTIVGGTMYPWRFFSYNPANDTWSIGTEHLHQWNTMTITNDGDIYAGVYPSRGLHRWNPAFPYTGPGFSLDHNPRRLIEKEDRPLPHVWRNTDIVASLPDNRYIVTAGYSYPEHPGGGLLFWDQETETFDLMSHGDLIPNHNNHSLVALPNNKLLIGTTVFQWFAEEHASVAQLYILDLETRQIEWQGSPIPDARTYFDMHLGPDGLVYIVVTHTRTSSPRLFVFDPDGKEIKTEIPIPDELGKTVKDQGPRVFVETPDERLFMLFNQGIVEVDMDTSTIQQRTGPPQGAKEFLKGGAYLNGRIYLTSEDHRLWSWAVPNSGDGNSNKWSFAPQRRWFP